MQWSDIVMSSMMAGMVNLVMLGLPVWGLKAVLQRWIDRRDQKHDMLVNDVVQLRDGEVKNIARELRDHRENDDERHVAARVSREKMHNELKTIQLTHVTKSECRRAHADMIGTVQKLAEVSTLTSAASKRVEQVAQQLIGVQTDMARMQGQVALKPRRQS